MILERWSPVSTAGTPGDPAGLSELLDAAWDAQVTTDNISSREVMEARAYEARADLAFRLTGRRLLVPNAVLPGVGDGDQRDRFDAELRDLGNAFPHLVEALQPDVSPREDARRMVQRAQGRLDDVRERRGRDGLISLVTDPAGSAAELTGALAGSVQDPVMLALNLLGGAGSIGKSILWNAARQGAINAGAQAAAEPFVQTWRRDAGVDFGLDQAVANVALAGVLGGTLDAGARSLARGYRSLTGSSAAALQGGFFRDAPALLDAAAFARPEGDVLRRAAEGDAAAIVEVAARTSDPTDAAARGAAAAVADEAALPTVPPTLRAMIDAQQIDDGAHYWSLAQAIRAEIDPREPPPPRLEAVPPQRTPDLADDRAAPGPAGHRFDVDGKPATMARVEARDVGVDAAVFQFKAGGDAAGATDRLAGVTRWDPTASGRAVLYERVNGELVIADGHQRLALARRLEADGHPPIELDAVVFREVDGWAPPDVRALAAKKNLQEGSGTAIDAAKVLRERPEILDASVPLSSAKLRQARALARLDPPAFGMVVGGLVEPGHAALVADLVPAGRHASTIEQLVEFRPETLQQARLAIGEVLQAPMTAETQMTLLGLSNGDPSRSSPARPPRATFSDPVSAEARAEVDRMQAAFDERRIDPAQDALAFALRDRPDAEGFAAAAQARAALELDEAKARADAGDVVEACKT